MVDDPTVYSPKQVDNFDYGGTLYVRESEYEKLWNKLQEPSGMSMKGWIPDFDYDKMIIENDSLRRENEALRRTVKQATEIIQSLSNLQNWPSY